MYFWQWKKNTTNVKFHHVRWFQYHFWLQIRFLHVKSPYRTIIKTTKWVIFHEIGWLQYCENTRIYYRELTSIWMNEWIWLGLSIFLSKNRRSTIKLWQRAAFTLLCFGLSTILGGDEFRRRRRRRSAHPGALHCLYHLSFFFRYYRKSAIYLIGM